MRYIYPAVFEKDDNAYSVSFPDIAGCNTFGGTLQEAFDMAEDALCLMLYDMEENGDAIPNPSDIKSLKLKETQFASLVSCDTVEYRKYFDNKAVKKTLTIPSWLNTMSERAGINFSSALQEALKEALHISDR